MEDGKVYEQEYANVTSFRTAEFGHTKWLIIEQEMPPTETQEKINLMDAEDVALGFRPDRRLLTVQVTYKD